MNERKTESARTPAMHGCPAALRPMLVALVLALPAMFASSAWAQSQSYGDIEVRAISPASVATMHGYAAYRFEVVNTDGSEAHVVQIALVGNGGSSGHRMSRISSAMHEVAPRGTTVVNLYQPAVPINDPLAEVTIDGELQTQKLSVGYGTHGDTDSMYFSHSGGGRPRPAILYATELSPGLKSDLVSEIEQQASRSTGEPWPYGDASVSVERWPRSWVAHSRFDVIILPADAIERMHADAREALWRYVSCGGQLLVVGDIEPPQPGIEVRASSFSPEVSAFSLGFGQCLMASGETLTDLDESSFRGMLNQWQSAATPFATQRSATDANNLFPVVDEFNIPVRSLLALVAVFGLVIGPVNLYLLSRMNRRMWMLWTVPAISLFFSVVVFGWAVVSEGWSPMARSQGMTVLDQRVHRASSVGWIGYYAPMTPGQAMRFDRDAVLNPQIATSWYESSGGQARQMRWGGDQQLTAGWIDARVPAHFTWRRSDQRRERVSVRRAEGELVAVNGLGAPIAELHVADAQGNLYQASDIAAGAEVRLEPAPGTATGAPDKLRDLYSVSNWHNSIRTLRRNADDFLQPDTYIAVLKESPFIEPGLDGLREHRSDWVVYGLMESMESDDASESQ